MIARCLLDRVNGVLNTEPKWTTSGEKTPIPTAAHYFNKTLRYCTPAVANL